MKVAVIADTHYGVRGDDPNLRSIQVRFMREVFLPTLKRNGITSVVHLGDLFDRKKYVNYLTARACWESLINPLREAGIEARYIVGNHDCYYRNTNEYNSIRTLYGEVVDVVTNPREVELYGKRFLLMPWICDENRDAAMDLIGRGHDAVLGHLEVTGFPMQKGQLCEGGLDPSLLDRSQVVLSGHFHGRSRRGQIEYVGATGHYTWADHGEERGFVVLDTGSMSTEHVPNPFEAFAKLHYDDSTEDESSIMERIARASVEGRYVKLVVNSKRDPFLLERVIDRVESSGVIDLQVVDGSRPDEEEFDPSAVRIVDDTDTLDVLVGMVEDGEAKLAMRDLYAKAQVRL